jgi:alkylation response protein AidB-like acyl-CoA dehydrogenase
MLVTDIREEILDRAHALIPRLQERADTCEELRRCPRETVDDFIDARLLRVCQPKRYGGFELGWDVLCDVSQILGRGDGSQAWVQSVYTDHAQMVGTFPLRAQDDVWGDTPNALTSASFDPLARAKRVHGGVVLSTRQGFASGIDHADWVICGGHIEETDGSRTRGYFLLPKTAVTVIDDWRVFGLTGTGSNSFTADEVFVPEYRIVSAAAMAGNGPGADEHAGIVYRIPRDSLAGTGFAAVGVGIAQGFLDDYLQYTRPRKSRGVSVAGQTGTQMAIGAAAAEIDSAARMYIGSARDIMATLDAGETVTVRQKLQSKLNSSYATGLALTAVQRLFTTAGGRALSESSVMGRRVRDLMAVASHHAMVWDAASSAYGELLLAEAG